MSKRMSPQKLAEIRAAVTPIPPNISGAWSNLVNDLIAELDALKLDLANARSVALEEAATTAETVTHALGYDPGTLNNEYSHGFDMGRHVAAEAIRALKEPIMTDSKEAGVGIDELARVFIEVAREKGYTGSLNVNAGLRAVLAKLEPTVADAFADGGQESTDDFDAPGWLGQHFPSPEEYATRWRKSISGDTDV